MAYQEKPGDLSVFKNDRKEKDTHPDYRISGTDLNGQKIKGALWLKKDRNGKTYMSGKIEVDDYDKSNSRQGGGGHTQDVAGSGRRDLDDPFGDTIPFVRPAFDCEA